jgi:hypothetical protein
MKPNLESRFVSPLKANTYDVKTLSEWFYAQALQHAELLDRRNGNQAYQDHFTYMERFVQANVQ